MVLHRIAKAERVLVEVPVDERGPILQRYVRVAVGARPHIPVPQGAPVEEFQAIADRYPVFAVYRDTPVACEPVTMSWLWPRTTLVAVLAAVTATWAVNRRHLADEPPPTKADRWFAILNRPVRAQAEPLDCAVSAPRDGCHDTPGQPTESDREVVPEHTHL